MGDGNREVSADLLLDRASKALRAAQFGDEPTSQPMWSAADAVGLAKVAQIAADSPHDGGRR